MLRYRNKTAYVKYVLTAAYLFQFINTWMPLVLINIDYKSDSNVRTISKKLDFELPAGRSFKTLILMGRFNDTTRDWI